MVATDCVYLFHRNKSLKVGRKAAWSVSTATATALALLVQSPSLVWAQTSEKRYFISINPTSVAEGLQNLESRTGISLVFSPSQVRDLRTNAVNGQLTVDEALRSMLAGTGLMVKADGRGSYVIVGPQAGAAPPANENAEVIRAAVPAGLPARAPSPTPTQSVLEEVIITGSRIIRDGYQAPTPLTVIESATIAQAATANIADQLRTMPVFAGNFSPTQGTGTPSSYGGGLNTLNLRSMGANRTLVLIDGQRVVSSRLDGVVDINTVPQQLIQRVDIVTGGASAVYGSDAVTGVVNFVLDKLFTGVKGEVSGGATTYGDAENYKIALTAGFPFAGDRGHIVISGEINNKAGILDSPRDWNQGHAGIITNPAYGTGSGQSTSVPERLVRDDVGLWYTKGGIIDRGPLKGIAFGQSGVPYMFNFGAITSGIYTAGGDYAQTEVRTDSKSLDPTARRKNAFLHVGYDVADHLNVFAQASWNSSFDDNVGFPHYQAGNGPVILSGNPFIPASIQAQMTALGLTSFQIGSMNYDLPFIGSRSTRQVNRNVLGASGSFAAFNTDWSWDAYFQNGYTRISYDSTGVTRRSLRTLAIDAVRHPTTGAIVCRSTLTAPNNGCVPYNPMGIGVNSSDVISYLTGSTTAHTNLRLTQNVWAGAVTGEPFATWAGPVSVAVSAERRTEKGVAVPDALTLLSDWQAGNFLPFNASYSVMESAFETVVPLIKGATIADSWDLSAAFRATDYSSSGYVSTWKIGTTFSPIADIKFRATRSRDIRAPNLSDLYNNVLAGFYTAFDPFTTSVPTFLLEQNGNPNLKPEKADTTNIGLVLQPSLLPGLSLSVDWWDINLKGALATPSLNQILQFCYQGNQAYCANIARAAGPGTPVTRLIQVPFNLAFQRTRGIDFEGSYRTDLSDVDAALPGEMGVHVNVTKYLKNYINNSLSPPTDNVGENGADAPPHWTLTMRLDYMLDALTTSLTARAMSSGTRLNTYIACTANCPVSTLNNRTISDNHLPGYVYLDAAVSYRFEIAQSELEAFMNIKNFTNKDPAIRAQTADEFGYIGHLTNTGKYDYLGRIFRAGIRFKM